MEYNYNNKNLPGGQAPLPHGAQEAPRPQEAQPRQEHQNTQDPDYASGWRYANGGFHSYGYQAPRSNVGTEPPKQEAAYQAVPAGKPKQKGRAGKVVGAVVLVAACAAAGFGGSYAAYSSFDTDTGSTVVYKQPQQDAAQPADVSASEGMSVSEISAIAQKSVVSIVTENLVADYFTGGRVQSGAGSGVIISEDGTIITNNHVVEGAQNITVTLPDGTEYTATVVGSDAATDIAVIKIDASGLIPAVIGDAENLNVGDFCIAVGNPMGTLEGTVTDGIISALDREITVGNHTMDLLQMSAAVSPGNSGGGLFNNKGELIGIVNAKSAGEGAEGLGFAIPANLAIEVAEELLDNGYVTGRPALGITAASIATAEDAQAAGLSQPGLYVQSVNPGSAAEKAGIQAGDRIVEANGVSISTLPELSEQLQSHKVGDSMDITLEREGTPVGVTVILQEQVVQTN